MKTYKSQSAVPLHLMRQDSFNTQCSMNNGMSPRGLPFKIKEETKANPITIRLRGNLDFSSMVKDVKFEGDVEQPSILRIPLLQSNNSHLRRPSISHMNLGQREIPSSKFKPHLQMIDQETQSNEDATKKHLDNKKKNRLADQNFSTQFEISKKQMEQAFISRNFSNEKTEKTSSLKKEKHRPRIQQPERKKTPSVFGGVIYHSSIKFDATYGDMNRLKKKTLFSNRKIFTRSLSRKRFEELNKEDDHLDS